MSRIIINELYKEAYNADGTKRLGVYDKESFDISQIPYEGMKRLGAIFREGEEKYGYGYLDFAVGKRDYQLERANCALKHLLIYVDWLETGEYLGERKGGVIEDDLAKVAWFCVTQMEIERVEKRRQ